VEECHCQAEAIVPAVLLAQHPAIAQPLENLAATLTLPG
jgi:hypothetical protein